MYQMLPAAVLAAAAARVYQTRRIAPPRRAYLGAAVRMAQAVLDEWGDAAPPSLVITDTASAWLLTLDGPDPYDAAAAAAFTIAVPALVARPLAAHLPRAHWLFRIAGALLLVYALSVFEEWTASGLRRPGATGTAAAAAAEPPPRRT